MFEHPLRRRWAVLVLFLISGCATLPGGRVGQAPGLTVDALRGPAVVVDETRLAADKAQACGRVEALRVSAPARTTAARDAGVLADDLEALRLEVAQLHVIITLRDSNQACAPHLTAGMESKGHQVLTKTFTAESLPPEFAYLAGTVSTLAAKPKPGEIIPDPLKVRYLTPEGKPLTCDYDMMDMLEANGARVPGESERDLSIRRALGAALPLRGDPPHRVDRIMHGAQAQYPDYIRHQQSIGKPEPPVLDIDKPEAPITALDANGEVYRVPTLEDALNFYSCKGAPLVPEWNLRRKSGAPLLIPSGSLPPARK